MNQRRALNGIQGLTGRDPIGAVLSVGKKNDRGFPVEKDRFHLVLPRESTGEDKVSRRLDHPAFADFNAGKPESRRVIRGNLVHATEAECFEYGLRAQLLRKPAHPNMAPQCTGDGVRALRWIGPGADNFQEMACPHDLCPYRQGENKLCKPHMRFLFRLNWREDSRAPRMLAKFTSGSWNTVLNFRGLFDYVARTAAQLGIREPSLFGFPFVLTLAEQTSAAKHARFPVVTITPDDVDPVEFFRLQHEARAALSAYQPEALPDPTQQDLRVRYEDVRQLSRGPAPDIQEAEIVPDKCDGSGLIPIPGSEQARVCAGCSSCRQN